MSSTEYKDDHADKTLTPRQQAEQKLSKTSDAVGKALNSRLTGSIVKKMPLSIGIAVAAAYLHINTGVSFHDAVQTYANIAKSVGTGTISHAIKEGVIGLTVEPILEAWYLVSRNPELTLTLYGATKGSSMMLDYLNGEQGKRRADIVEKSPIKIYREHLKQFDEDNTMSPPKDWKNPFTGTQGMLIEKAVSLLRRVPVLNKLGFVNDRSAYKQAEVNFLHNLVFMHQLRGQAPGIDAHLNNDVYKHPAFDSIFANADTLGNALIPNIENYHTFSRSVYNSLSGMEDVLFNIRPEMSHTEKERLINREFERLSSMSLKEAYQTYDQHVVIKDSLSQILNTMHAMRGEYGLSAVSVDDAEHLASMLKSCGKAIQAYDVDMPQGAYAKVGQHLVKAGDNLHRSANIAILMQGNNTPNTINLSSVRLLRPFSKASAYVNKRTSEAEQMVWLSMLPDEPFDTTIDGLAARALIKNIDAALYRRERDRNHDISHENDSKAHNYAKDKATERTMEIGRRSAYTYSSKIDDDFNHTEYVAMNQTNNNINTAIASQRLNAGSSQPAPHNSAQPSPAQKQVSNAVSIRLKI